MKAAYKHIALAALALSAVACTQDDDFAPSYLSDPDAVRITAQVGAGDVTGGFTRSNPLGTAEDQAKFNNGDQIAVTAGTQTPVTYQLGTDGWNPVSTDYLKWQTNEMSVTAYYPVGKNNASATTFNVPAVYTDLAALADADYMTYSGTQTKGTDNAIALEMERKMVRIVIDEISFNNQFLNEEGEADYTVTAITVHGNTKGYTNGAVEAGNVEITAYKHTDGAYYALLAPTTAANGATFLTVTVTHNTNIDDVHTLIVKGIPATTPGNSYMYSLTVGKDVATIGSVSVTDWTGATIDGGEAEEYLRPTVKVSGNTAMITVPEYTFTEWVTEAVENAVSGGATTIVVNGSTDDACYKTIINARSGNAVYFEDLTTDNYVSAAGKTYTCGVGSVSDEKYVLISKEKHTYEVGNSAEYADDFIRQFNKQDPGARTISKDETAWTVYTSYVETPENQSLNFLYANEGRIVYLTSLNRWLYDTWTGGWRNITIAWYPAFDVPLK